MKNEKKDLLIKSLEHELAQTREQVVFQLGEKEAMRNQLENAREELSLLKQQATVSRNHSQSITELNHKQVDNKTLEKLRSVIMYAPVAMCLLRGRDQVVELANERMLELWGKKESEVMDRPIFQGLPELKGQGFEKMLEGVFATGLTFVANEQPAAIARNGKTENTYINFAYEALKENDGSVSGIVAVAIEVTEQVKARKKIEESEKRYHNLIYTSPSAIGVLKGEDLVITTANDAILEIWGKGRDIIGKKYFEALPELAEQGYDKVFSEVYQSGKPFNAIETPVEILQNGKTELKYYNFLLYAQRNAIAEIDGIGIIATEVTSQALLNKQIEESHQQFISLANNIHNLAWMANADGWIFWYNSRWYEYTGTTPEQMEGWGWTSVHDPKELPFVIERWQHSLDAGETFEMVFPIKGADDKFRSFITRVVPLRDDEGKIIRWVGTNTDITEQKETQSLLEYRKALLEAHNESSFDGLLLVDLNGKILSYNKRFTEIWNMPKHIIDARDDKAALEFAMTQLENPDQFIEKVKYLYDNPTEISTDVLEFKDGKVVERHGYPVVAEDGTNYAWSWTFKDITQNREAERKITESEQRFRTVADSAPVLIWMSGTDTLCYFFNKAWLTFTGRTMGQENGNGWTESVHPEDLQRCLNVYLSSFEGREQFYIEYRLRRNDGEYRWVSNNGVPRFTPDETFEGFVGACMDIHERILIEDILKKSERRFRLLADSMPQFIWTATAEGKLNYFSKTVYEYSGLSVEEMERVGWLQIVHPDEREENIRVWMNSIATGEPFHFEHRFRRHDGEYTWQLSRALPQKDANGTIQMWVGTSTQIQQQKELREELQQLVNERTLELVKSNEILENTNQELQKMNKELHAFSYVASHDLQEPLRKIQTFSTRIMEKESHNLSEMGKDYFVRMRNAASRMQGLIEDLLTFSRLTTAERNFENTELKNIVDDVLAEFKEILTEKNATVRVEELGSANVITFQFRQLMHNLITNSIKFSRTDVPLEITIKSDIVTFDADIRKNFLTGNDYLHITVQDNGIGFEPQYSERIFQVFQRLHGKSEYPGTGIGLAIVKKIVDNHNGIINAHGEPNKGARFDIYIPA